MRILEIESLFQQEDTLNEVLTKCEEDFKIVDYWSEVRKQNLTDNPEEILRALNELSGCYSNLRTILGIAETEKKNREVKFKENLRIESGKSDEKYVDAKASTQATAHVTKYRRIRNYIQAYVESCDKHICTLQSILKSLDKEHNNPQG